MISLLCPSRGRPDNMRRFAMTAFETAAHPERVDVWFRVDDDDDTIDRAMGRLRGDCNVLIGPRGVLSTLWNDVAVLAPGDILGHMGDDIAFRTDGWDVAVEEAFAAVPDRIVFVHGRDGGGEGMHDAMFGTHGFLHRNWCAAVGYFVPPYFVSDCNDAWLNVVANALGRRVYLPGVLTEHLHPGLGKAAMDNTYQERWQAGVDANINAVWDATARLRHMDIEKLRAVMCE